MVIILWERSKSCASENWQRYGEKPQKEKKVATSPNPPLSICLPINQYNQQQQPSCLSFSSTSLFSCNSDLQSADSLLHIASPLFSLSPNSVVTRSVSFSDLCVFFFCVFMCSRVWFGFGFEGLRWSPWISSASPKRTLLFLKVTILLFFFQFFERLLGFCMKYMKF